MTPTGLTLRRLRQLGFTADVCERRVSIPGKTITRDLFGIGDVIAVHARDRFALLIQCTSLAHVGDRLRRVRQRRELRDWLTVGRFEVWGWAKRGERWEVRVVAVSGD